MCKCDPNCRTPFCGKPGCEVPEQKYRPTPDRLIVGPVTHLYGMIHDAEGNHICDVRGYGRLQYMKDGEDLQDGIGEWLAAAINARLDSNPI